MDWRSKLLLSKLTGLKNIFKNPFSYITGLIYGNRNF